MVDVRKDSKLFVIGNKGRNELIKLRVKGATYQQMTDYLNNTYKNLLNEKDKFTLTNVYSFFRTGGQEEVNRLKETNFQKLEKELDTSPILSKMLRIMSKWIDDWDKEGKQLRQKDIANFVLQLHEIRLKEKELMKDKGDDTFQNYLTKVQQQLVHSSINGKPGQFRKKTAEIEYNDDGSIKKKTISEEISGNEEETTENEEKVEEKCESE